MIEIDFLDGTGDFTEEWNSKKAGNSVLKRIFILCTKNYGKRKRLQNFICKLDRS